MFPLHAPRTFENAVRASVVQLLSSKVTETFVFCDSVLIRNTQTYKPQLSVLRVFKIPEITSMAEFLSSEAGANDVSAEELL